MTKGVIFVSKALKEKIAEFTKDEFSDYLLPHIIFNSTREAIIEGSKGIVEYKPDIVRINCGEYILKFKGKNLSVLAPATDEITVRGDIIAFEFSSC